MDAEGRSRVAASPLARTEAPVLALRCDQSACDLSPFDPNPGQTRRLNRPATCSVLLRADQNCTLGIFMAGTALPTAPISDVRCGISGRQRLVQIAGRYSLSAIGPIAVSGAHFGASLMFLHRMSPREFGMFSFLLVVVPFCLSVSSGLLGAPLLNAVGKPEAVAETKGAAFREVNRFYFLTARALTALLMYFSGAEKLTSVLL